MRPCVWQITQQCRENLIYLGLVNKPLKESSISQDEKATQSDDNELVKRAQRGDEAAFRQLFERHHRRAYAVAIGVVRNPEDALDVVQDAFIKAHRHLAKFQGTSSFYTWLYRIVTNLAIDHLRKRRRVKQVDFSDALSHEGHHEAVDEGLLPRILGSNPDKSMIRKEIRVQIGQALDGLSDNHRAVLVMRELEGLTYEEMASAMNCSKGTIMSRLFHARKNMQRQLLEYMDAESDPECSS